MTPSVVGTWRLKQWETHSADGRISYPLGPNAIGYLIYTPQGYMTVSMMQVDRPAFAGDDLIGGTLEEKAAAASSYVTYCGRYEVQDRTVIHHVELSLFPNWIGVDQLRFVEVEGDDLLITTPPLQVGGREVINRLIWERAE